MINGAWYIAVRTVGEPSRDLSTIQRLPAGVLQAGILMWRGYWKRREKFWQDSAWSLS